MWGKTSACHHYGIFKNSAYKGIKVTFTCLKTKGNLHADLSRQEYIGPQEKGRCRPFFMQTHLVCLEQLYSLCKIFA